MRIVLNTVNCTAMGTSLTQWTSQVRKAISKTVNDTEVRTASNSVNYTGVKIFSNTMNCIRWMLCSILKLHIREDCFYDSEPKRSEDYLQCSGDSNTRQYTWIPVLEKESHNQVHLWRKVGNYFAWFLPMTSTRKVVMGSSYLCMISLHLSSGRKILEDKCHIR